MSDFRGRDSDSRRGDRRRSRSDSRRRNRKRSRSRSDSRDRRSRYSDRNRDHYENWSDSQRYGPRQDDRDRDDFRNDRLSDAWHASGRGHNSREASLQQNAMAAAALQAAQWASASNNGYPSSSAVPTNVSRPAHLQPPVKMKPQWPPPFELNGGAYVFQAPSGTFHEPLSQFYYCPKSKLYYSLQNGVYYHYAGPQGVGVDPAACFVRFNPPIPTGPEPTASSDITGDGTQTTGMGAAGNAGSAPGDSINNTAAGVESMLRKPVVLSMTIGPMSGVKTVKKNLATAASSASAGASAGAAAVVKSATEKKTSEDLKRWQAAGASLESNDHAESVRGTDHVKPVSSASGVGEKSSGRSASTVSSGDIIACLLCRRQFASREQLERHERESKLHKENLARAAAQGTDEGTGNPQLSSSSSSSSSSSGAGSQGTGSEPAYRDRASERRAIHQQSAQPGMISHLDRERERDREWSGGADDRGGQDFQRRTSFDSTHRGGDSGRYHSNSVVVPTTTGTPAEPVPLSIDDTNTGNQLLRKMGWSDGTGLGRHGRGKEEAVGVMMAKDTANSGGGGGGGGKRIAGIGAADSGIPPVNYKARGKEYKESLLRAARARYEQVSKDS